MMTLKVGVVMCGRKWRRQPTIYMHDDGGFYPDLEHAVQSAVDDDPSRPYPAYPALLKDPAVAAAAAGRAKTPAGESISSHCCSLAHGYTVGGELGLYWEGRRPTV